MTYDIATLFVLRMFELFDFQWFMLLWCQVAELFF